MNSSDSSPTPSWPETDWISPSISIELPRPAGMYHAIKPVIDIGLALLLLIPGLPIILGCWLIVRLTSSGPGFYSQVRSGLDGRPYRIIKLRTMQHNIESKTGIQWSQKGDSRVTPIGKILRATHLDELPQLFNVLRGEMSLVGPRPERPEVINGKGLCHQVPGYNLRLSVKPGVTGFAQIQLPADSDLRSVRHKVVYDIYYITQQGLWTDLRIIIATAFKALGLRPNWLRRLFRLPTRETVVDEFCRIALPNSTQLPPEAGLQPA